MVAYRWEEEVEGKMELTANGWCRVYFGIYENVPKLIVAMVTITQ
jgi:hypothetical protein